MKKIISGLLVLAAVLSASVNAASWRSVSQDVEVITTAGANTFICPSERLHLILIGGGGGGGGGLNDASFGGGGGGGSGQITERDYYCTPGDSLTVTVGAGGTAGSGGTSGNVTAGGNGGDTTITGSSVEIGTVTAKGGLGGALGVAAGGAGGGTNGSGFASVTGPAAATACNYTTTVGPYNSGAVLRHYSSGSGGGATASNPGACINLKTDATYRSATNGGGGSGGNNMYAADSVNVGGAGTGVGATAPSVTSGCHGCGGGGGGGSNGAAGNGAAGHKGAAIITWQK